VLTELISLISLQHYTGSCPEGQENIKKKNCQESALGRDFNLLHPEYEAGALNPRLRHSPTQCQILSLQETNKTDRDNYNAVDNFDVQNMYRLCNFLSFRSGVPEDSVLLRYDAASLDNRIPTF
jgi:hypothetical protein